MRHPDENQANDWKKPVMDRCFLNSNNNSFIGSRHINLKTATFAFDNAVLNPRLLSRSLKR